MGSIPTRLASITTLQEIYLKENKFSGNSLEAGFCAVGKQQHFEDLEADCGGNTPKVACSCCTICCEGMICYEPAQPPELVQNQTTLPPAAAQERFEVLTQKLESISGKVFDDSSTPQYKAAWWMAQSDPALIDVDGNAADFDVITQRYVMTLLWFSTGGESWTVQAGFMTEESACSWSSGRIGVECDSAGLITGLEMGNNNLNGTMPFEIEYLVNLEILNLGE